MTIVQIRTVLAGLLYLTIGLWFIANAYERGVYHKVYKIFIKKYSKKTIKLVMCLSSVYMIIFWPIELYKGIKRRKEKHNEQ